MRVVNLASMGAITFSFDKPIDDNNRAALVHDPVGDNYYILTGSGKLYRVNATTGALAHVDTVKESIDGGRPFTKMGWMPGLRGLGVIASQNTSNFYFYPVRA